MEWVHRFFLSFVILLLSYNVSAFSNPAAEIVSLDGIGEFRPEVVEAWSDATVNQDLFAGSLVRTGPVSRMGILFSDRTQVRLNEKTLLRIKAIREPSADASKTILNLDHGRAWTQTKDVPAGLIMETPSATAAIRGTDWDLEVDEKGTSTITVLSGEVTFYNDFGTVTVSRNQQARAEIGKAPVTLFIVRPADRVQWVTAYAVDPLRHISFFKGTPIELKAALENIQGPSARAHAERGSIQAALSRWEEAGQSFEAALGMDAKNSQALTGLGYVALQKRQPRLAETFFKHAPTIPFDQELLELGKITVHIQDQAIDKAFIRLHALCTRTIPLQPAPYLILSELMVYNGELQQAISMLETAFHQFPGDLRLLSQLANLYLMDDQPDQSRNHIQEALSINENSYEARIAMGKLAHIQGKGKAAASAFTKARDLKPDDDQAWYGLGVIESEQEKVEAARTNLVRAFELNPHVSGYMGEQGTLETFANNFSTAESAFKNALEYNPADYIALTGLGVMRLKQGHTEAALDLFLAAGLIEPRYARVHLYTGVAYYQLGRVSQAIEELERASELDDKDPMPHFLRSIIYTDLLRPGDAMVHARQALKLMPYLKSLNQLANTQRGTTNLGQAFAFMGMEDWSRMYARESYSPYWAGSHLFLADRYAGLFTKNSELFQGFMTDPTVFGTDSRFQNLVSRPGLNFNASLRGTTSDTFDGSSPLIEIGGFYNQGVPSAFYLAYERFGLDFDYGPYDTETATIGLGGMPQHNLGVFVFADHSDLQRGINSSAYGITVNTDEDLTTDRRDLGISYKFLPTSQFWFKLGQFRSDNNVRGFITDSIFNFPQDIDMDVGVNSPELAFRHTFDLLDRHEVSWGAETAHRKTTTHYDQADMMDSYFIWETLANDVIHQEYSEESNDFYISDQFRINSKILVQMDLFYQRHDRTAHEDFDWRFPLYPGVVIQQGPDVDEQYTENHLSPRLGLVYRWRPDKLIRMAYQNWIRPASQGSLGPVATAGIPLEDRMVLRGGELNRYCGQFEWEISTRTFINASLDYKEIDNNIFSVTTPYTVTELESLGKLRSRDLGSLTREDLLEFANTPEYEGGRIQSAGISFNHLLTEHWGLFGKYIHTASENTGDSFKGNDVPFLPEHTVSMGAAWTDPTGWYFVSRLVFRSKRYADEANTIKLEEGFDGAADLYWQSKNKNWLFRFSVDDVFDRNQSPQYTAEINFRY